METAQVVEPIPYQMREGVKLLCRRDGAVLLIQEEHDDGTPFWTLPGGGVEPGESLGEALHREVREELQCAVNEVERIGRIWYRHTSRPMTVTRYSVFTGTMTSAPEPNPDHGVRSSRWVDDGSIPERTLDCVERLLGRLRRHPSGMSLESNN